MGGGLATAGRHMGGRLAAGGHGGEGLAAVGGLLDGRLADLTSFLSQFPFSRTITEVF